LNNTVEIGPVDVSVVITAYNVEGYIARTVQSALAQTGPRIEVIVVDDCSTDGTWNILSAIGGPRLHIKRLEQNGGPSIARNTAIAMASGAWIAILDGDDAYLPGRLQRCLDRAKAQTADIVVDNLLIHRESDGRDFPMFPEAMFRKLGSIDLARFIAGNRLFALGYSLGYLKPVFSAAFLHRYKLAYDPALRIGEDYLLFAEALASGAVCAVEPSQGYVYTVRAGSISHRLTLGDIERMAASDSILATKYAFDRKAQAAYRRRTYSLCEARAFTSLVDALKQKDVLAAARAVSSCPTAIRHLWRPLVARIDRIFAGRIPHDR
jgi:succinoglycan biosynthesis protein ExoO